MSKNNTSFSVKNSYSQALFELANEKNSIIEVERQVLSILGLINKSSDFNDLIKDPTNKIEDQLKVINAISNQYKFNQLLKNFLSFVVSKRRFFYIEKILNDFISICSGSRGEIQAELYVAKNLDENEISKIREDLSNNYNSNIKLNYKNDPSLIGGLIIKVGSTMIDASIKNKLQQIEKKMIEA